MKDYKRLTDRDDDGIPYVKCADCYIRDKCDLTKEVCYQELQDRLAEIEDKIESGEIDYVVDRDKEIARLATENAELKSSLTHANEEGLKWHERAQNLLKDSGGSISGYEKKISDLQAKNAELRHRLEVEERPLYCLARSFAEAMCKDGDTHHLIEGFIKDAYRQAKGEFAEEKNND